jgi:hypothetical protein
MGSKLISKEAFDFVRENYLEYRDEELAYKVSVME